MSAPKNIQRDALYINLDPDTRLTWSSEGDIGGTTGIITTNPSVHYDFGSAMANFKATPTLTKGKYIAVGLAMQQPVADRVPYRVKASTNIPAEGTGTALLMIGYTDVSNSVGADVVVEAFTLIPFKDYLDELIIIEPNPAAYLGRPLIFGIAYATTADLTANIAGQISVQNLGVKPPTMHNAVS